MTKPLNLLWLQSGGCGGCTMSLLCSGASRLFDQLADVGINVLWHPALSEQSGAEALALLEGCAEGRLPLDFLCIEGALLRGPNGSGRFHVLSGTGKPMTEVILDSAEQKGTGRWTVQEALELGVPIPTISAAVEARGLSALKAQRVAASRRLSGPAAAKRGNRGGPKPRRPDPAKAGQ